MKPWNFACISRFISRSAAGLSLAFLLLSCATLPQPGESHLRYAERHGYVTTLPDLLEGRQLMVQKCTGCHSLPRILNKRHNPETWPAIMDSMRVEAKLSSHQDSLIRTFILVASGQRRDSLAALKLAK